MSAATLNTVPHALVTAMVAAGHGIAASTHAALEYIGNTISRSIEESRREHDEAYLAEATDCSDLERRMRDLDHAQRGNAFWVD
ncbi:DUF3563 family protein [Noviherbaspirillum sp. ST9]|uniref:DUF3563 family protein n=1 Tax=Noviherbaspirillum sp. ST9 TaxID=3401606 RepID=UPI003B58804F